MLPEIGQPKIRWSHKADNGKAHAAAAREMITVLIGAQEFYIDEMLVREICVWTPVADARVRVARRSSEQS
jgi:chemotaxis signal transduction protein